MICLNVWLTVKDPADVAAIRELLNRQGQMSRGEAGCLRFEVYQSQTVAAKFLLCEHWASQEALDQHRRGQAYTEIYQPHVLPKVQREPHPSTLVG